MVAVTGATGFLGKHIVTRLVAEGYKVLAFGRNEEKGKLLESKNCTFVKWDICDTSALEVNLKGVDIVIHSAAKSSAWGEYQSFYQTNVTGTKNLLERAIDARVKRIIHISSSSVYFDFKEKLNIKESDPYATRFCNHYATTKQLAEQEVLKASHKIETVILRPRGIIGEGDTSILPRIMGIAQRGKFPLVSQGSALVDITYVENVVQAIFLSLTTSEAAGEIFNISNDQPVKVKYLVETLFEIACMDVKLLRISRPLMHMMARLVEVIYKVFVQKEPPVTRYSMGLISYTQTLDIAKAKRVLGYKPVVSLEEGIRRSVEDYKKGQ